MIYRGKLLNFGIIIVFFALFSVTTTYAQTYDIPLEDYSGEPLVVPVDNTPTLSLSTSPKYPAPNQKVTVSLKSFSTDLNAAQITWYVDGKRVQSGRGIKSIDVTAGAVDSATVIKASITTSDSSASQSITIRPALVSLMWQSDSYVPPFYKGKALPGPGSQVKVLAIPQLKGNSLNQTDYNFEWSINGRVIGEQSGYGRNSIIISIPTIDRNTTLSVHVSNTNGTLNAENTINLKPVRPQVVVYPFSRAIGTRYEQAIGDTIKLNSQENTFSVIPYYINTLQTPTYTWTMNDKTLSDQTESFLTLRNNTDEHGTSEISVFARTDSSNQSNTKSFSLQF
jgi:hypothetical protein